ncbi:DUF1573 domain-containing protein [Flavobacteriaceae bacterium]|jgi:hypothetical protein|nr:DUF1573 domain-containing protein [Flavobacteriaceae bacterium]MDA8877575.1 DUF1573 domain-containing protein [Flavobacteriaceae bacterium]MDA9851809.1 DUF1573 domain-containing protein [Flavobacteriaceae bacterium]MDC0872345.1 DUF1573 domain-containing protein [Flavobacteriaceae bacterium]
MKKLNRIFLVASLALLVSCQDGAAKKITNANPVNTTQASQPAVKTDSPVMSFDKTTHDFGTIKEGEKVTTKFSFTNTGKSDLIIVDARGSCGCTVPEYPKNTPIKPGDTQTITVSFDSSNKPGVQQKSVTLSANTASGREMLRIKANVTPDPAKQKLRDAQSR